MDIGSRLNAYREAVDARLETLLPPADLEPSELHAAMRYSVLAPGKRLRPALCMAGAEAVGCDGERVLDAAAALELVHAFSLVHDDLPAIDDDDLRRGRPTTHVEFGEAVAVLAGDALFALAFEVLGRGPWPAERRADASFRVAVAAGGLVRGEVLDVLREGFDPDLDLTSRIHRQKTAALIRCACELGGLLGGGSADDVDRLGCYGEALGLAFQIADDVLNATSTPEELGKAAGSDAERGKQTYPASLGVEASRREAARLADEAVVALEGLPGDVSTLRALARFAATERKS